jgi:hypothetical protein
MPDRRIAVAENARQGSRSGSEDGGRGPELGD